jgi:hypothetical protein
VAELSPGAQRALDRLSERLSASQRAYLDALVALVPFVEEAARAGDNLAQHLLDEKERARVRMVSETMEAAALLLE